MRLNYYNCFFLGVGHILALLGVYSLYKYSLTVWLEFWLIIQLCGLGITVGAHRLWAHRTFETHPILEFFLMILNSSCHQGHIIYWCRDHRTHHKFADTDKDPHSITKGFFYAHMGWLLEKRPKIVSNARKTIVMDDLYQNKIVMLQYHLFPWWNIFWCFVFTTVYGSWRLQNICDGFLIFGVLRWIYILQVTWCVNSVAHMFGYRPYSQTMKARESWITSFLAGGEGWHNFHHMYPYDYSTSEFGIFQQWNPGKLFIDTMSLFGLASKLRKARLKNK